jgi:TRAP-type C4-dicarboxylate transport system permease small subunit
MAFLEKFGKLNQLISSWIQWIGLSALLLMMCITCVDVLGAKAFRAPVFGALDVMMLAQLIAVTFAASIALLLDRHVQVEFFVILLPKRFKAVIDCMIHFLCLALFVLLVWRLFVFGYGLLAGGEETATARIPVAPFVYAAAIACIPVCLVFLHRFIGSIIKFVKK